MGKPYKDSATLDDIITDGWSRGFEIEQTMDECRMMGYEVDYNLVFDKWELLTTEMDEYFKAT